MNRCHALGRCVKESHYRGTGASCCSSGDRLSLALRLTGEAWSEVVWSRSLHPVALEIGGRSGRTKACFTSISLWRERLIFTSACAVQAGFSQNILLRARRGSIVSDTFFVQSARTSMSTVGTQKASSMVFTHLSCQPFKSGVRRSTAGFSILWNGAISCCGDIALHVDSLTISSD